MWASLRALETTAHADGSATTHVVVRCSLADVARATNLRVEDAAFALNECGLLVRRRADDSRSPPKITNGDDGEEDGEGASDAGVVIAVTREMVEAVAKQRDVKRMCMDLAHVLL